MKNITNIQLRSARQALNIGVRDIAGLLKVSKATVSKAELGKTRDFFFKYSPSLIEFFKNNNIIFPNEYTIRLNIEDSLKSQYASKDNINRFQLKTARCVLNFSQNDLASSFCIDKGVISRAELNSNLEQIKPRDPELITTIKNMFMSYGIEFPDPYSTFFKKYIDNTLN